ncbi:DUF4913 domain-containing protein [Kineosporia rhizophila]|uniref:DUF4913 domain-containing protein n=1 Tax=Kineosporia rhizophila TaxID=84633 RepID=UPI001E5CA283|nr:DUF4913 domain-containing protein [Kineosporia rhizophila]MCE0540403.1 DUF4913 domain-containing protein [Kineosporia rhizophila]
MTEQLLSPTPLPEAAGERVETFLRWFTDVLSPVLTAEWGRNDRVLCEHWWEHPEAVARLLALHDAWTVMVEGDEDSEPSADGPSRWWIEHFDPHLDALLHPGKGPFRFCRNGHAPEKFTGWPAPDAGQLHLPAIDGPADAGEAAAALDLTD